MKRSKTTLITAEIINVILGSTQCPRVVLSQILSRGEQLTLVAIIMEQLNMTVMPIKI